MNGQTPAPMLRGRVNSQRSRTVATNPLRLEDIRLMLRTGLADTEIIEAIADRQLVEPVSPIEATNLRVLGAGTVLIRHLQGRELSLDPGPSATGSGTVAAAPLTPPRLATPPPAVGAATPVDYMVRDRRIESLKQQINALDEQIRIIRNNPKGLSPLGALRWQWQRGVSQSALQKYLDQLDQQRDTLRREKWRLEGR